MSSYGLFHHQSGKASSASNKGGNMTKNTRTTAPAATAARESASSSPLSSSSSIMKIRRGGGVVDGKNKSKNSQATLVSPAAPAFEMYEYADDSASTSTATNQHKNDLLERHTSAAKDGVIDMLTAKASKLGVTLERTLLAKREAEDGAGRLQALYDEEATKRKSLQHLLDQKQAENETSAQEIGHLKWEVDSLRLELKDAEERSKEWIQKEVERRRSAEEAMDKERSVAMEYLSGVYRNGEGPEIGSDGGTPIAEALVRELHALGGTLRERNSDLGELHGQLDTARSEVQDERARHQATEEQLVFMQERFEAAKQKARQLSGQLEAEVGDSQALRMRLRSVEEESLIRSRSLKERKAKAQQRKRGEARDTMAESKAKDDRIKALESTLMKERARLEGELQSARSDYEEAAKESRRKAGRLQRRCLELEYRLTTQSKGPDVGNGGGNLRGGGKAIAEETGGKREGAASSETLPSSPGSTPPPPLTGGLISAASMLPWRRGSGSSASPATPATTASSMKSKLGLSPAAAAATGGGENEKGSGGGGGGGGVRAEGRGGRVVAGWEEARGGRGTIFSRSNSSSSSFSNMTAAATVLGARRPSADRLPDPTLHNEGAPAWMREDCAIDRVVD